MIRRPPRSTHCISSAASDVYKRQHHVDESARGRQKYSFTPSASTRVSKKWDYSSMRGSLEDESKLVTKGDRRRSQTPSTPTATRHEERTRQHNRARGRRSSATKVTAPAPKDEGIRGIPLWAVPLLLIATLVTGAVISMSGGTLGWIYLVCFGLISLCICLLYTSPSPRDKRQSRMPSSA